MGWNCLAHNARAFLIQGFSSRLDSIDSLAPARSPLKPERNHFRDLLQKIRKWLTAVDSFKNRAPVPLEYGFCLDLCRQNSRLLAQVLFHQPASGDDHQH